MNSVLKSFTFSVIAVIYGIQINNDIGCKSSQSKRKPTAVVRSDESLALLRLIQIAASGGNVDIVQHLGKHESTKFPPSPCF